MNAIATHRPWTSLAILLSAIALAGCGGSEPSAEASSKPVKAPYSTADELLAHVNTLYARDPIDVDGLWAHYHTENELQRRLLRTARSLRSYDEMAHRVYQRFGRGMNNLMDYSPLSPLPPAEIVDRTPQRAIARTTLPDKSIFDIYLVQVGERWWISGYSLERVFENRRMAELLADTDFSEVAHAASTFMARVDRGEFQDIEAVRTAWLEHLRP